MIFLFCKEYISTLTSGKFLFEKVKADELIELVILYRNLIRNENFIVTINNNIVNYIHSVDETFNMDNPINNYGATLEIIANDIGKLISRYNDVLEKTVK